MRVKLAKCVVGLCVLTPGCNLVGNATHNVMSEIHLAAEDHSEHRRNQVRAQHAWDEFRGAHADRTFSEDFADGFQEGFADYLYAGGDGEPPALPPRQYWKSSYQTPEGYQSMEDWFAGFRQGAGVAEHSGYRRYLTLPSSLAGPPAGPEVHPAPAIVPVPEKPGSVLPAPQEVTRAPAPAVAPPPVADRSQPKGRILTLTAATAAGLEPLAHDTMSDSAAAPPPLESVPRARVVGLVAGRPRLTAPQGN